MLGEVLGVAPGAIEHWRRTGVPEAHADSVVLLRETAERIHAHHRDEAVAVLLRIPIGDCAGRSILDLLRERDGEALDRAFAALQPWTDRPSSARRSAPADVGTSTVAHVMSRMPVTVDAGTSLREAAQRMRDADIGDVIVIEHGRPSAILTDRDIVVRAVAEQRDPLLTRVASIASGPLVAVSPDAPIRSAVTTMRANGLRRLPVLDGGRLVGVVSLGDIAVQRQPESPLASIVGEQRSD
jgi:CBS domain-containing protein